MKNFLDKTKVNFNNVIKSENYCANINLKIFYEIYAYQRTKLAQMFVCSKEGPKWKINKVN